MKGTTTRRRFHGAWLPPNRAARTRHFADKQACLQAAVVEQCSNFVGIATLEGRLTFVNVAGQKLIGVTDPARIPHMTMLDYVAPEDRRVWADAMKMAIAEGDRSGELRVFNLITEEQIPVFVSLFVLRDRRTHAPVALASVIHDLTRENRSLELRERVLGIVSHDLRNPLTAIMMGASLIRDAAESSAKTVFGAKRIVASARRMDAIIGDLLDLTKARLGGGIEVRPVTIDSHLSVGRIVEEMRLAHPNNKIVFRTSGDGRCEWDPPRLDQVVSNLIANAIEYGAPDTPVTVESRGTTVGWTLSVHNLGEPIPDDILPQLFEPFRRCGDRHRRYQGKHLGLGLFIVRIAVEAHGGTVEVTSRPGQGTRFLVRRACT